MPYCWSLERELAKLGYALTRPGERPRNRPFPTGNNGNGSVGGVTQSGTNEPTEQVNLMEDEAAMANIISELQEYGCIIEELN